MSWILTGVEPLLHIEHNHKCSERRCTVGNMLSREEALKNCTVPTGWSKVILSVPKIDQQIAVNH